MGLTSSESCRLAEKDLQAIKLLKEDNMLCHFLAGDVGQVIEAAVLSVVDNVCQDLQPQAQDRDANGLLKWSSGWLECTTTFLLHPTE
mmetsp:Transcript_42878/g.104836  ORF Transcript_42878/g.104836 Transcript_42878/m.104836 type:complete len:88 (-) Transcript_42878:34-297(-)|eukprot:CAMPEP_0206253392 /NCGR_PEP_ID=MMETSP0047_2-20121206/23126_1 /ASSEMBLY_ACC=CAM_ASM_000192 /TAXON_ID=195065 /ORGANISM="Chroomonas mesostigmatica_cf, Strain CCMP1168" /LENGTH=87 /DNA_ID=CAMNT_0053679595 /DNA_START=256 /DNA_END=519 /DNA_ORIENTATION=-